MDGDYSSDGFASRYIVKDGGAAFAGIRMTRDKEGYDCYQNGMSLRDYFAAAALGALLRNGSPPTTLAASVSYEYADAMLLERQKLQGETK